MRENFTETVKEEKGFDPRTDKMLDIKSDENYLQESLDNFRPPKDKSMDKSKISNILDRTAISADK